jgi:hydrogenase-4 membrane subunit HyfE
VIVDLVVLIAGAVFLLSGRTGPVLAAYLVLAIMGSALAAPLASGSAMTLAFFSTASVLKLVVTPLLIVLFLRANPTAGDLRPSIAMPARLLLVVAFAVLSEALARAPSMAGISVVPLREMIGYVVLCGIGMLIVHRSLLGQMIGLLVLGVAVTQAGVVIAPMLPEFIELGAAFDALLVTCIGLLLVRSILAHNPLLDVDALRKLRG